MDVSVETQLEAATLAAWAEQLPAIEVGELYDELREALTQAQQDYQAARARGYRGNADADKAVAEICALTTLLDAVVDSLIWRRGLYRSRGRRPVC